jgi:rRNA maturation endonuclease Nob1
MQALLAYLARMEGYASIQEMLQATGTHMPAVCKRCGHVMSVQKHQKCNECGSSDVLIATARRSVRTHGQLKGLGNPKQPR